MGIEAKTTERLIDLDGARADGDDKLFSFEVKDGDKTVVVTVLAMDA